MGRFVASLMATVCEPPVEIDNSVIPKLCDW